ncbi:MAG: hypothetical protein D6B27_03495, partial [Gammaproteobacteria bacterium]
MGNNKMKNRICFMEVNESQRIKNIFTALLLLFMSVSAGAVTPQRLLVRMSADYFDSASKLKRQSYTENDSRFKNTRLLNKQRIGHSKMAMTTASIPAVYRWLIVEVKSHETADAVIEELKLNPSVEYIEKDVPVQSLMTPDDPRYSSQHGLDNNGSTLGSVVGADIDAARAWDIETGSDEVIVAVIDSGIDVDHEDLKDNIWVNTGEIAGNGIDDDQNGYIDDVYGWDFWGDDNDINPENTNTKWGHGTHVAGIISAKGNNGIGVAGVAWNVKLMGVRFSEGDANETNIEQVTSNAVQAIVYAVDNGAHIINASFGGAVDTVPQFVTDAIEHARENDVLIVCAAGNAPVDIDTFNFPPATMPQENILTVTATDRADKYHSDYSYGLTSVDVAAPGISILSTFPDNKYKLSSGTSMSAPFVSGLAALLLSQDPSRSALDLKRIIMDTVDPIPSLQGKIVTGGRINAYKALSYEDVG